MTGTGQATAALTTCSELKASKSSEEQEKKAKDQGKDKAAVAQQKDQEPAEQDGDL